MDEANKEGAATAKLVLLSADDAQEISRLLNLLTSDPNSESKLVTSSTFTVSRKTLIETAQTELIKRLRRTELLPKKMFGEPAWEILLALYIQHSSGPVAIGRLSSVSTASSTTILRWIDYLHKNKFITRDTDATDKRSVLVSLTEVAIVALDNYFSSILARNEHSD